MQKDNNSGKTQKIEQKQKLPTPIDSQGDVHMESDVKDVKKEKQSQNLSNFKLDNQACKEQNINIKENFSYKNNNIQEKKGKQSKEQQSQNQKIIQKKSQEQKERKQMQEKKEKKEHNDEQEKQEKQENKEKQEKQEIKEEKQKDKKEDNNSLEKNENAIIKSMNNNQDTETKEKKEEKYENTGQKYNKQIDLNENIQEEKAQKQRAQKQRVQKEKVQTEKAQKKKAQKQRAQKQRAQKENIQKEKVQKQRAQKEKEQEEKKKRILQQKILQTHNFLQNVQTKLKKLQQLLDSLRSRQSLNLEQRFSKNQQANVQLNKVQSQIQDKIKQQSELQSDQKVNEKIKQKQTQILHFMLQFSSQSKKIQEQFHQKMLKQINNKEYQMLFQQQNKIKPKDFHFQAIKQLQQSKKIDENRLSKLKKVQKYINQLKICIQVYNCDPKYLRQFHFNKDRYFQLMKKKVSFIQKLQALKQTQYQQIKQICNNQYNEIDKQMASMQQQMSIQLLVEAYKYSPQVIQKTHQQLVEQSLNSKIQNLLKCLQRITLQKEDLKQKFEESQQNIKLLEAQLEDKRKKMNDAKQKQIKSLQKRLNPKDNQLSRQMILKNQIDQRLYKVIIQNQEQIKELYKKLANQDIIAHNINQLKAKQEERLKLQKELNELAKQKRKPEKNIDVYLQKTSNYPQESKDLRDDGIQKLQIQLCDMMQRCQQIQSYKTKPKTQSRSSEIRISSILG